MSIDLVLVMLICLAVGVVYVNGKNAGYRTHERRLQEEIEAYKNRLKEEDEYLNENNRKSK